MRGAIRNWLIATLLAASVLCSPAFAIHARGGGSPSTAGFLAPGHWIASPIASLTPIFPLGDNVTYAYARIHQAYWDGTNDIDYDVALGDAFGAYPYVCTLVQGPPGMVVEQSTYTTFQNPSYCRVLWHPQGNISSAWNGEVEVAVTDQQHDTIYMSWALWTVGQYSTASFTGSATVNGSSTLSVNCSSGCTGTIVPGMVITGADIPSGTYVAFDLTGTGGTGTYALSTAATGSAGPESISGSYAGGAVFVSTSGSGTTCSYGTPCTFTQAFGSTLAATSYPGALCYVFGGSYTGATNLPAFSDNSGYFEAYGSRKPNALIGIPGQTVTLDGSASEHLMYVVLGAGDWYTENITVNGYDSSTGAQDQLIVLGTSRVTFDQVNWTNSGWGPNGTPPSGNMSFFVSAGTSPLRQYLFITDSQESNRQTGTGGNNFGFIDLYAYQYALVQRNVEDSPSADLDAAFFFKVDEQNSEMRENWSNIAGAEYSFSMFGSQFAGVGNDQFDYNLDLNNLHEDLGQNAAFTWIGNSAYYRNTVTSGTNTGFNVAQTTFNLEGPGDNGWIGIAGTTGGSLTTGDSYTCGVTSVGVSGESATIIGSYGNASGSESGAVAGASNHNSITLSGSDTAIVLTWLNEPGAQSYNAYCEVEGSGVWTEYTNVTSPFTYTGTGGTTNTPPSPSTALSGGTYDIYSNAFETTNATPPPPTGATITAPAYPTSLFNIVDSGGASALVCLNTTTTGCTTGQIGDLNTTYSGTYGTYSSLIGTVGYKIQ